MATRQRKCARAVGLGHGNLRPLLSMLDVVQFVVNLVHQGLLLERLVVLRLPELRLHGPPNGRSRRRR